MFVDAKLNKDGLEDELAKVKARQGAFDVKLKRIKVKTNKTNTNTSPVAEKRSIKEL